jgi:hypothetical protein
MQGFFLEQASLEHGDGDVRAAHGGGPLYRPRAPLLLSRQGGEATDFLREMAEMALAQVVGNAIERAYQRGDSITKRRDLMAAWAEYREKGQQRPASRKPSDPDVRSVILIAPEPC